MKSVADKFTAGPWKVSENGTDIETIDGAGIATLYAVSDTQDKANAQLLATAPELLDALELLYATYQSDLANAQPGSLVHKALCKAQDAIEKVIA